VPTFCCLRSMKCNDAVSEVQQVLTLARAHTFELHPRRCERSMLQLELSFEICHVCVKGAGSISLSVEQFGKRYIYAYSVTKTPEKDDDGTRHSSECVQCTGIERTPGGEVIWRRLTFSQSSNTCMIAYLGEDMAALTSNCSKNRLHPLQQNTSLSSQFH